jgi:hypothetical protein
MMPCKEVVRILSSGEELGFLRKSELIIHLTICRHCNAYNQHLIAMRKSFKQLYRQITAVEPKTIENLENKILRNLGKLG